MKNIDQRKEVRSEKFFCKLLGILLISIFMTQLNAFSSELRPPVDIDEENNYDSLIVQVKDKLQRSKRLTRLMYRAGASETKKIKENLYVVTLNNIENKEETISKLKESRLFNLVEPNYKLEIDGDVQERNYTKVNKEPETSLSINQNNEAKEITPNDKGFSSQYYLREIKATKAWNASTGDSITVGILDTGVNLFHPDLEGKVIGTVDEDLNDELGHGTEVAGIIAANTNNYQGIAGIGWNTKVFSIKVTDELGQARVSTVVSALERAYEEGVKIVQISLSTNQFSQTLRNAIQDATDQGILIVSTGGNTGEHEIRYPAAFHEVIGVGAVDENKEKELYSTKGEHITLVAPGANIYTTSSYSSYKEVSGTSFSAPQVAGAAALVWSIAPDLTNEEVRNILIESATDLGEEGKDINFGYGILNIEKAVELAKERINN